MFSQTFRVSNFTRIKQQLLIWSGQFSSCCFMDNNQYGSPLQQQECLVAAGALHELNASAGIALKQLQQFIDQHSGQWIFGHVCYDVKDEIEGLPYKKRNEIDFAPLSFFVPQVVIRLSANSIIISSEIFLPENIWAEICGTANPNNGSLGSADLKPRITRQQYFDIIDQLKNHIHRGDCYEINFCQEFYTETACIDPVQLYDRLNKLSPNPFSCYYKIKQSHLLCASPERYLALIGNELFSQPIKGTASRNLKNAADDEIKRQQLQNDKKERSENVMVVDLVRNDLSRICVEGTVKVTELFGIYTYPQVHQMISTVSGQVKPGTSFTDILTATFPMGSMTGAPKKRVMELIDQYEQGSRGLFSGTVGYITPEGTFDFNVVIRSILYNSQTNYLSYWVGGGITWYSKKEEECEECMLKAMAMKKVLQTATP